MRRTLSAVCFSTLLALALSACAGNQAAANNSSGHQVPTGSATEENSSSSNTAASNKSMPSAHPKGRIPTDQFIVDRQWSKVTESFSAEPLEGYSLKVNMVVDAEEQPTFREGKLYGETVVFGVPDGKGDRGKSYELALDRAAELVSDGKLSQLAMTEHIVEGSIALVRLETPGYPSGQKSDTTIPVTMLPMGNAGSLMGGHIYSTTLKCLSTGDELALCAYTTFTEENVEGFEAYFKRIRIDDIFKPLDRIRGDEENETTQPEEDESEGRHESRYILKSGFKMLRNTGYEDIGRSEIVLTVYTGRRLNNRGEYEKVVDPDVVDGVFEQFSQNPLGYKVSRIEDNPRKLRVVPTIANRTMRDLYDHLRLQTFWIKPRKQLHVIMDDQYGRILIAGQKRHRKLLSRLELAMEATDQKRYGPSGDFRFVAEPIDNREKLRVNWVRYKNDSRVDGGSAEIVNDIGDLMRMLYGGGMSPQDCIITLVKASDQASLLAKFVELPNAARPDPTEE